MASKHASSAVSTLNAIPNAIFQIFVVSDLNQIVCIPFKYSDLVFTCSGNLTEHPIEMCFARSRLITAYCIFSRNVTEVPLLSLSWSCALSN